VGEGWPKAGVRFFNAVRIARSFLFAADVSNKGRTPIQMNLKLFLIIDVVLQVNKRIRQHPTIS
jgi:hypothetical protein